MGRLINKDVTGYKELKKALGERYKLVSQYKNNVNGKDELKYYVAKLEA